MRFGSAVARGHAGKWIILTSGLVHSRSIELGQEGNKIDAVHARHAAHRHDARGKLVGRIPASFGAEHLGSLWPAADDFADFHVTVSRRPRPSAHGRPCQVDAVHFGDIAAASDYGY